MYKSKVTVIGLFSFLMLFSVIPPSQAELWELVIDLNIQNIVINSGDDIVVIGKVVNHAYMPIIGAEVFIRAGSDSIKTFTDADGAFRGEFTEFQRIPGTYTVNVITSWNGMTGLSSTQFQVKGDGSPVSALQEKLSTNEARNYLGAKKSDFEKNPIGQTLFKYYHGLLDELILEQKEAREPLAGQIYLEQQRAIAKELINQDIEKSSSISGTYGGSMYVNYINNINPKIKELIVSQLNFTKNIFEEGQKLRDEILANGGTYEEARNAYLDSISIPKEVLEQFNQGKLDEKAEESPSEDQTSEEDSENQ